MNDGVENGVEVVYLGAAACFVLGLHLMNSPATARRGNQLSAAGMIAAVLAALVHLIDAGTVKPVGWLVIAVGAAVGGSEDVAHSQAEHIEADELLGQLAKTDPASEDFDRVLQKVVDAVSHHVEEEESTVLPGMRTNIGPDRLQTLAKAFATTREEHPAREKDAECRGNTPGTRASPGRSGDDGLESWHVEAPGGHGARGDCP